MAVLTPLPPNNDEQPARLGPHRTTLWAWFALACSVVSLLLWLLWQVEGLWALTQGSMAFAALAGILGTTGWYFGGFGVYLHFLARRHVFRAERTGEPVDGDFTALLSALIGTGALILWNHETGPLRSAIAFIAVLLTRNTDWSIDVAVGIDGLIVLLVILSVLLYATISGPPAMRRFVAVCVLTTFAAGIVAPLLLRGRDHQRESLGQNRAAEVGIGVMKFLNEKRGVR